MRNQKFLRKGIVRNKDSGITLIALVVTIIILLILAGISIAMLTGQNGILNRASEAKRVSGTNQTDEQVKIAVGGALAKGLGTISYNDLKEELDERFNEYSLTPAGESESWTLEVNGLEYTITGTGVVERVGGSLADNTSGNSGNSGNSGETGNSGNSGVTPETPTPTTPAETVPTTTSYVGYYADLTADGTVDGVIYADLAIGREDGIFNATEEPSYGEHGVYTIPIVTGLKNYYVSQTEYNGPFGKKDVLSPTGTGSDRFYVMALEDISGDNYECYYSAKWRDNFAIATSVDFGKGKTNTQTMISKWNNEDYGTRNANTSCNDMWGAIQTQFSNGWFVPSRGEWAAFGNELSLSPDNYRSHGLREIYWSSSESGDRFVCWNVEFIYGYISASDDHCYVRLSSTF